MRVSRRRLLATALLLGVPWFVLNTGCNKFPRLIPPLSKASSKSDDPLVAADLTAKPKVPDQPEQALAQAEEDDPITTQAVSQKRLPQPTLPSREVRLVGRLHRQPGNPTTGTDAGWHLLGAFDDLPTSLTRSVRLAEDPRLDFFREGDRVWTTGFLRPFGPSDVRLQLSTIGLSDN